MKNIETIINRRHTFVAHLMVLCGVSYGVMNILIAGINGFVGKHLAQQAHLLGHTVIGIGTQDTVDQSIADICSSYRQIDLTNQEAVASLQLADVDAVINLAGLAAVGPSFDQPELYKAVNVEVHTNLINYLNKQSLRVRYVAVSTGAVYDNTQQMPIQESGALLSEDSGSPYAQSKIAMEKAVLEAKGSVEVVVARPFNHFGPGQDTGFLIPDLYSKLVAAQQANENSISVGPTNKARDYTDVRDVAKAYLALCTADLKDHAIFNVCSGVSRTVQEILDTMQQQLGTNLEAKVDESLIRPHDPDTIYGDNSLIQKTAAWQPSHTFEQTLKDFIDSQN